MLLRLVSIVLALLIQPDATGTLAAVPDTTKSATLAAERDGPFEDLGELFDWIDENTPMAGGQIANPGSGRPGSYYVLDRDSTVWIQAPTGETLRLDAYIPYVLGQTIDGELKYSANPHKGIGWGFENDELLIYITSGLPLWIVGGLLVLVPLGLVVGIHWLWRRLRLATERGVQLAESRRRLADSREDERLRLARDLHDGPLQDLQAVRMRLGVVQRANAHDAAPPANALAPVQDTLLQVVRELRSVSEGLRPPVLGPFGLAAALRALAARATEAHPDLAIDLDLHGDGTRLGESARIALYRIAQESINNAATHGRADRVRVHYDEDDGIRLAVQDDGDGFEVPATLYSLEADGHLGVAGMSERIEAIGGTFSIESTPGEGTRVSVWAPASLLSVQLAA